MSRLKEISAAGAASGREARRERRRGRSMTGVVTVERGGDCRGRRLGHSGFAGGGKLAEGDVYEKSRVAQAG